MRKTLSRTLSLLFLLSCCAFVSPTFATAAGPVPPAEPEGWLPLALADTIREGQPLERPGTTAGAVSRRTALEAAFLGLGWDFEITMAEDLASGGFLENLCRHVTPMPPLQFLDEPGKALDEADIQDLFDWIRQSRIFLSWDFSVAGEKTTLKVHRQGVAPRQGDWEVRLASGLSREAAIGKIMEFEGKGVSFALRDTGNGLFDLIAGPFPSFLEATRAFSLLMPSPGLLIVPAPGFSGSPPLFWAALVTEVSSFPPVLRFASEIGRAKASLSDLAAASGAEAALNGGVFSSSGPVGTVVSGGKLLNGSFADRSAIGFSQGIPPVFGNGTLSLSLEAGTGIVSLDRFNELPRRDETSLFVGSGPLPPPVIPASADRITVPVLAEITGSFSEPPAAGILVGRGEGMLRLRNIASGENVRVTARWQESRFENLTTVLQAGPRLLENGLETSREESFDGDTRLKKHPRTIAGWDGTSLWWIVVDGRAPNHSLGLTLAESASLAISLGLRDALNFDGGGSSALWWRGKLVTLPAGGRERPLPYAILFGAPSGTPPR